MADDDLVDMTDEVADLCDDIVDAIATSELEPAAALFACMQVLFEHIGNEAGMAAVRGLFDQFEASWRADQDHRAAVPYHQPQQGVLQ